MDCHVRRISGDNHIWSVENLWKASTGLPVKDVEIERLGVLDCDRWYVGMEEPTVRSIAEHCNRIMGADLEVPIILCPDGVAMDGSHRVAKAWLLGLDKIKAVQFTVLPPADQIEPIR